MILTKNGPQGLICPHPGAIYMYISIIFKHLSSETTWPIKAKFYVKHLKDGIINVYIDNSGHMTKMAARPIYGNLLLWNQWTDFKETWLEASMAQVLQCIYKS